MLPETINIKMSTVLLALQSVCNILHEDKTELERLTVRIKENERLKEQLLNLEGVKS